MVIIHGYSGVKARITGLKVINPIDRRKDGGVYWCMESISPVKDASGTITHFVAVIEGISERKSTEATIRHLAFYDALTDLPNRRLLRDHLEQSIAWSRRAGGMVALLYLDLGRRYQRQRAGRGPDGDARRRDFDHRRPRGRRRRLPPHLDPGAAGRVGPGRRRRRPLRQRLALGPRLVRRLADLRSGPQGDALRRQRPL